MIETVFIHKHPNLIENVFLQTSQYILLKREGQIYFIQPEENR